MPIYTVTVPGVPIAQHRPRFARRGKFVQTYSDQATEAGKFLLLAKQQIPKCAPQGVSVSVNCNFIFPIPKSATKKRLREICDMDYAHLTKPDVSNLLKFLEDCLNRIAWLDDAQVDHIQCRKTYAVSEEPHTEIVISWGVINHSAAPGAKINRLKAEDI